MGIEVEQFQFTDQQRKVIEHTNGALLVAAGPGTGKTRVIVERIARLVERQIATPKEILALTFSRGAATEMMQRVAHRLTDRSGPITFSTFHSFSLGLIHEHHPSLGYPTPPRVILMREQIELIRTILTTIDGPSLDPIKVLTKRPFGPRVISETLAELYERVDQAIDPDLYAALKSIESAYKKIRQNASLIDHASMVPEAVQLLDTHSELAQRLQQQFKFVIVDEYQDTSTAQERLLELLAPPPAPLMVVGDDDQSIYAFRGATPSNLQAFAERRGAVRLDLTENWRCGAAVQNAATTLISHNTSRLQKTVQTHPSSGNGTIEWLCFEGLDAHARGLAELVDDELRKNSRPYRDIAILWRTLTHPLADRLLDHLLRLGIPARTARGKSHGVGLQSAIAALIELHDSSDGSPHDARNTILESVLNGANPVMTQRALRETHRTRRTLEETIEHLDGGDTSYQDLREALAAIERVKKTKATTAPEFMHAIWLEFPALHDTARSLLSTDIAIATPARQTIGAVTSLTADAEAFALANPTAPLSKWALRLRQDTLATDDAVETVDTLDDCVLLLTVHQAKGLEWPVVLTPAMEEGFFPTNHHARDILQVLTTSGSSPTRAALIEEERRLFYVALTRAKERAVVSFDPEGQHRPATRSRFLSELGIAPQPAEPDNHPRTPTEAQTLLRRQLRGGNPTVRATAASALATLPVHQRRRWWTASADAPAPPGLPDGDIDTTVTALTDFRACPFRFRCQHILGLRGPTDAPRGIGTIFHKALQDFHAPDADHPFDATTLRRLLERHWDNSQFLFAPIAEQARRDALQYIGLYVYHHPTRHNALAVEQDISFNVAGLNIRGKIDAIFSHPEGTEIVDFKTGRSPMSSKRAENDLQLGLYSLAFDHARDLERYDSPTSAAYIYLHALRSIEASEKARPTTTVDGSRRRPTSPKHRAMVASKIEQYATAMRAGDFPTKSQLLVRGPDVPNGDLEVIRDRGMCRYCDFRRLCPDFSTTPT